MMRQALALLLVVGAAPAWADGAALVATCGDAEQIFKHQGSGASLANAGACMGTLRGAIEMMAEYKSYAPIELQVCVTTPPSGEQMLFIFLNYARAHPGEWQKSESVIIGRAFLEAYPCKTK